MAKYPAFQFYPSDWLSDNIAGCSLAAQGLWLRMMLIMHSAERRGYLAMNGGPMSDDFVSRRCGCEAEAYRSLLAELFDAGIPSRTSDGIIYNRRMVKDEIKRANYSLGNKGKGIVRTQMETQIPRKPPPKSSEDEEEDVSLAFDGQKAFEEFCELYPMPDRSSRAQTAFWQAVQGIGKRRSLDDSGAFLWLKQRTAAYLGVWSLQPHTMLKFLETGVYDWEVSAWETEKDHKRISTGMRREYKATPEEEAKYEELRKKYAAAGKP